MILRSFIESSKYYIGSNGKISVADKNKFV